MNILTISGSPRTADSLTSVLAKVIDAQAQQAGFQNKLWLLGEQPLPLADPAYHKDPLSAEHPADVRTFAQAVDHADVIVLATPIYNGSYSAHLKNALDSLRWDNFRGKIIILSSQGNPASAGIVLSHLNEVARTLQGSVHNSYIVVDRSDIDVTSQTITSQGSIDRISTILSSTKNQ